MDMKGGTLGNTGNKNIIWWDCGTGLNQKFKDASQNEDNVLLPLLHANNLPIIQRFSL